MKDTRLKAIAEIISENSVIIGDAMLRLRLAIGHEMAQALLAGECKTVQGSACEAAQYIKKVTGRSYAVAWWRTCYLYETKLSPEQKRLIIEKHVPVKVVDRAVNSKVEVMNQLLDDGMCDRKRVRSRAVARLGRRPALINALDHGSDGIADVRWDEDRIVNMLANILSAIVSGRATVTVLEFDKLVREAKVQAGVRG